MSSPQTDSSALLGAHLLSIVFRGSLGFPLLSKTFETRCLEEGDPCSMPPTARASCQLLPTQVRPNSDRLLQITPHLEREGHLGGTDRGKRWALSYEQTCPEASIYHLLSGSVPTTCLRFPNPPRPALLSCRIASVAAHQVPLSRQPHIPTRHPHMSPVLPHSLALVRYPQQTALEDLTRVKFTVSTPSAWNTSHSWPSVNSAAVPHGHAPGLPATLLRSLLPQ